MPLRQAVVEEHVGAEGMVTEGGAAMRADVRDVIFGHGAERGGDRGPPRPKLNPKPRRAREEDACSASTSQASGAASVFGGQGLLAQLLGNETGRVAKGAGETAASAGRATTRRAASGEEGPARRADEKEVGGCVPKGRHGNSSCDPGDGGTDQWRESERKVGKKAPTPFL